MSDSLSDPTKPRLRVAERKQITFRTASLDQLVSEDHSVRSVWNYVEQVDLSSLYASIRSVEGKPGHPAIDPKILLALWLYATVDGIGSARELDRLCTEHQVYQWICGGVTVNYHSLADFRVEAVDLLDRLLTEGVAALASQGLVTVHRVAQDGMKVRANAGSSSFRSEKTLEKHLAKARQQVERLRQEVNDDPSASNRRQKAARERSAREREERVAEALKQLQVLRAKKKTEELKATTRASKTDPDARYMRMGDDGFRPAYNVEFGTDTASGVIVGVDVVNTGDDRTQLVPMVEQIQERYGVPPGEIVADAGFSTHENINKLSAAPYYTIAYCPVPDRKTGPRTAIPVLSLADSLMPQRPIPGPTEAITKWRVRMSTDEAKEIYKLRCQTAEWVNAMARNRGLHQFPVRGLIKVKAVALWQAVTHNLFCAKRLMGNLAAAAIK